jgi:GxxExxY protein
MTTQELTYEIIGAAYEVHKVLGGGFLENVYENALVVELEKRGLKVEQQYKTPVIYKGVLVGDYVADLFINKSIIVELKAVLELKSIHEVQLVNYLNATKTDIGLLLNFGESKVDIKKKFRKYNKQN